MSWAAFALPSPATVGLAEQLCAEPRADRPEEDTRACSVAQVAALAAGADGAASQAVALSEAPAPRAEPLRHWRPLLGRPLPPFLVRRRADVMHLGQAEPLQQAGAGLRAAVDLGAPLPPISPVLVVRLAPHGSPQRAELETRLSVWLRGTPGAPLPAAERHRLRHFVLGCPRTLGGTRGNPLYAPASRGSSAIALLAPTLAHRGPAPSAAHPEPASRPPSRVGNQRRPRIPCRCPLSPI